MGHDNARNISYMSFRRRRRSTPTSARPHNTQVVHQTPLVVRLISNLFFHSVASSCPSLFCCVCVCSCVQRVVSSRHNCTHIHLHTLPSRSHHTRTHTQ